MFVERVLERFLEMFVERFLEGVLEIFKVLRKIPRKGHRNVRRKVLERSSNIIPLLIAVIIHECVFPPQRASWAGYRTWASGRRTAGGPCSTVKVSGLCPRGLVSIIE